MPDTTQLVSLRDNLRAGFNPTDLRSLCLDLNLDYDDFARDSKKATILALLDHIQRTGRLPDLITSARQMRPNLPWPDPQLDPPLAAGHPLPAPQNPFFVGGRIHDPHHFFVRERPVREIRGDLKQRSSVALIGASQMGKSSLLTYLEATRDEWLPGVPLKYVDLQNVLDEADFCETVLRALGQPGSDLRALKWALSGRDMVLLLDEIERLAEADFNPRLHDLLRSLAQEKGLGLCVAAERPLTELFPGRPGVGVSPFHNIFITRRLEAWTAAECRHFLTTRLADSGLHFSERELTDLIGTSQGNPARLQYLAWELAEQKR